MNSINDTENKLFEEWNIEFGKNGDFGFCYDGLIYNGELTSNSMNRSSGNQEELWNNSKRKIVFLMKDPNNNEGEDYREWGLYQKTSSRFFRFIYSWLNGLSKISSHGSIPPMVKELDTSIPLCIVNVKKASGKSHVSYGEVYDHFNKYSAFLKLQLDIYTPNIIVCGGSWKMADIAKKTYAGTDFIKMDNSNWIWYSIEKKLVIIDSYHPCAYLSNEEKYNTLILEFQKFLILKLFDL